MILPTDLIKEILEILETNKDKIISKRISYAESGEEKDKNLIEPYIAVYSDFDNRAEFTEIRYPVNMPVSIYLTCKSSSYDTVVKSFNEAFLMAVKAMRLVVGSYKVKNIDGKDETTTISCQDIPIVILSKSAKGSAVEAQLQYFINDLLG